MERVLLFSVFVTISSAAILHLNESEYALMPPMVQLDPYERCISQPGALYCDVTFALVSDGPSALLTMIQEYSAHTQTHFNHSVLHYGLCVKETCREFYNETNADIKTTLEACLNKTMWETYKLKTRVTDEFNCNVHEKVLDKGIGDTIVAIVCIVILLLNIVGSIYDNYFPGKASNKGIQSLQCFSIMRNWSKLSAPLRSDADPRLKQLQSLHGFRAITTILVITVHSGVPYYMLGQNSQFVEEVYANVDVQVLVNGTMVMQTFFIMSGFLLVYHSLLQEEKKPATWTMLPKHIVLRWLRLTPPYAIMLGLSATWFRYLSMGPIWQKIVGQEAEDCRRDWWKHLLYINNYEDNSYCMPQTWYLAADTQLYTFGVLVYLLCKSPRVRNILLPSLFVVGILIPGLHTYFQDLDAVMIISPGTVLNLFMHNAVYDRVYKRGHTNLAGCTLGLALGYFIYHCQNNGLKGETYHKYRFVYRSLWLIGTALAYMGSMFYGPRPRDPLYFRVLYSIVVKPVFAILVLATIAGTILRIEGLYRGILEWRCWTCVSRLSYSSYLWHVQYARAATAATTAAIHVSHAVVNQYILVTVVVSFLMGLIFWLLVEAPLAGIMKTCLTPEIDRKVNGQSVHNDDSVTKDKDL